ncbi:MAG: hypothetical protein OXI24_20640, partial [Candidatus Poribacteria bacterium]|nr:hypothetical protein [Candidatus Poribacteria bacterium]
MKKIMLLFIAMLLPLGLPLGSSAYVCGTPALKAGWQIGSEEGWNEAPSAPELPAAPALLVGTERTFFAPDFRSMQQYT